MEMSNKSSLDRLYLNIRWLKEWSRTNVQYKGFLFPYTAIWLVLSGSVVIELDKVRHTVKAGNIVCIPPQTFQSWIAMKGNEPFRYLSLACEAKVETFDLVRMYRFPHIAYAIDEKAFHTLIQKWYSLAQSFSELLRHFNEKDLKQANPEQNFGRRDFPVFRFNVEQTIEYLKVRSLGYDWMLHLYQCLRPLLPNQPIFYDSRVFEVCDYVEKHLNMRPHLDELANTVSLSPEHLRTLFQKEMGISPMKYVSNVRFQRAQELLLLTSHSIKQISEMLGFEDQHHFSRSFRRIGGISPSMYRNRNRNLIKERPKTSLSYPKFVHTASVRNIPGLIL